MSHCPHCQTPLEADPSQTQTRCPSCGGLLIKSDDDERRELVASAVAIDQQSAERTASSNASDTHDFDGQLNELEQFVDDATKTALFEPFDEAHDESVSHEQQSHMRTLWERAIGPQSKPGMSLKTHEVSVSPESTLSIRACALHPTEDVPLDGNTDYELLERVGEGGMGVVYAARQASMDRVVAVKMLRGEIARDHAQRDKFLSEAVVTAELDHPNIVPIHDLGTNESGALFYSMKHIQGIPWSEVIRERSLTENLDVLLKVCDAIAFAHTRGIVHRDLKPENVMLGDFGEVLVMDWGLAQTTDRFRKAETAPQRAGLGGTPAYMAPEMAKGNLDQIGKTSDVYLLGATLFEVITGKPPHMGKDTMACLYAAAANKIRESEETGELLDVALRAMATKPDDRYADVQSLQAAIRDYQSHVESIRLADHAAEELLQAKQTLDYQDFAEALYGYKEALTLWSDNQRARIGLSEAQLAYARQAADREDYDLASSLLDLSQSTHLELEREIEACRQDRDSRLRRLETSKRLAKALTGLILMTVAVAFLWIREDRNRARQAEELAIAENVRANDNLAEANRQKSKAQDNLEQAEKEKDAKEYESYVAQIGLAAEKIEENAFREARHLVARAARSPHKHWEWGRLKYLCRENSQRLDTPAQIDGVAFSGDGLLLAASNRQGDVFVWWRSDLTRDPLVIHHPGCFVHDVAFAPHRPWIATAASDGWIRIVDVTSGAVIQAHHAHQDSVLCLDFSSDGRWLLTGSYDQTACLWRISSKAQFELHQTLRDHSWWVWDVAFSPDGTRVLTTGHDGKATVWSIGDDQRYSKFIEFTGHEGPVYCGSFCADGKLVVTGGHDKRILIWNSDELQPVDIKKHVSGELASQVEFRALDGHAAPIRSVSVSPDGTRVVSGSMDNSIKVWDTETGELYRTLRGHEREIRACVFSPDGRFVLSGSHDRTARLWNIGNYREVRLLQTQTFDEHTDGVLSAAFSSDGRHLVTAGRDRTARIWDLRSGQLLGDLQEGHEYLVSTVAFFPDGKRILTGGGDDTARIWDLTTGTEQVRIDATGNNGVVALAADGRSVLSGHGHLVRFHSLPESKLRFEFADHDANITAVACSPDNQLLFSADATGHGALWNATTGQLIWKKRHHTAAITSAYFYSDGSRVITSSADHTVSRWSTDTGSEHQASLLKHPDAVQAMAVARDDSWAITSCTDGIVRIWDLDQNRVLREIKVRSETQTFANNLRRVMRSGQWKTDTLAESVGLSRTRIRSLFEAREQPTPDELSRLAEVFRVEQTQLRNPQVEAVDISPDGEYLLAVVASERTVRVFEASTGIERGTPRAPKEPFLSLPSEAELLWSAAFTPDGQRIVTLGGNDVRLWSLESGKQLVSLSPHGTIASARFDALGSRIVTASWDNSAKVWDRITRKAICKLSGHERNVNSAMFSSDGLRILTASDDGTVRIWNADDGHAIRTLRGHRGPVLDAAYASQGERIISASSDGTARIWDTHTGKELLVLRDLSRMASSEDASNDRFLSHTSAVRCIGVFERNGMTLIATGGEDGTAKLWDGAKGELLKTFEGHMSTVTSVAFSPDGRRLVTGSQDANAKIWDAQNGKEVLTLKGHKQEVTSVAFSPDGRFVLTSSRDGLVTLWPSEKFIDSDGAL